MPNKELKIDKNLANWVKFFAAIGVALHHYVQHIAPYMTSSNIFVKMFTHVVGDYSGYLAVAVFFFLSGYGLMESEKRNHLRFIPFLKKRILRVYLPVLLVSAIWIPIKSHLLHLSIIKGGAIYRLLWTFDDDILWFVRILLVLYIAFAIFAWVRHGYGIKRALFIFNILTLTVTLAAATGIAGFGFGRGAMMSVPLFTAGAISSLYNKSIYGCISKGTIGYMIWFAAVIGIYLASGIFLDKNIMTPMLLIKYATYNWGFILIITILLTRYNIKTATCPALLASISYDIYIVHNKVLVSLTTLEQTVSFITFAFTVSICVLAFYTLRKRLNI